MSVIPEEIAAYCASGTVTETGERQYRYVDRDGKEFTIEWGMDGRWIVSPA